MPELPRRLLLTTWQDSNKEANQQEGHGGQANLVQTEGGWDDPRQG